MQKRKNSGFTIFELMVVLMIIFILLSIAAISGNEALNKYRMESQTKQMYIDLMNARVSALSKNRKCFVTLTPTQYTIYEDSNPANPALDGDGALQTASDTRVMQVKLDGKYSLTIPAAAAEIDFDARGLASAVPGPIGTQQTIYPATSYGSAYDCIVISQTRIQMGAWNGTSCNVQ